MPTATTKSARYYDAVTNRSASSAPITDLPVDGSNTLTTTAVAVNAILAVLRRSGDIAVN